MRLRDDDGGLPFIRCASCRMDHPVGAVRCELCEADLTTARQRSYNLALRERWLSEREEERRQIEVMALARRQAEQEVREAEQLFWSAHRGGEAEPNPLVRRLDLLGGRLGVWLAQQVPDRRWRHGLVGGLAALWLMALWAWPGLTAVATFVAVGVGVFLVADRKTGE